MYEVCSFWSRFRTGSLEAFFHPAYFLEAVCLTSAISGLHTTASRPGPFFSFMRGAYQAGGGILGVAQNILPPYTMHLQQAFCAGVNTKRRFILILRYPRTASAYYRFLLFLVFFVVGQEGNLGMDTRPTGRIGNNRSWATAFIPERVGSCIMIDCINTVGKAFFPCVNHLLDPEF